MAKERKPSWIERLGVAIGKSLLPVIFFLWGDLSPRAVRLWAWIFWVLAWPFQWSDRRVIRQNLLVAFPEKSEWERRRIGRESQLHFIGTALDWLHTLKHPESAEERLEKTPEFVKNCTASNPSGKSPSAIYCTLHLGNWETASRISYLTGRPGAVVVARFKVEWFNDLAKRLRTDADDTTVIQRDGAARGVLQALDAGRNVGILIDQNVSPRQGGIYQNFFGLPATTSRLPAYAARKRQVPLYVVACIKRPDGAFFMDYCPMEKNAWEYDSDEALTAAVFRAYEELIRRHPEQYLWSYRRWRSIPANTPSTIVAKFPSYAVQKKYTCPEELFS